MTAIEYLHHLETLGLVVRVRPDGRLGVSPPDLITPGMQDGIRQHKDGMTEALLMRERAERLFGGETAEAMEAHQPTTTPDDAPDLVELLAWWDDNKNALPMPLKLAPAVTLEDTSIMDKWINDSLTGNCRGRVAAQLRWIRKAAEQQ